MNKEIPFHFVRGFSHVYFTYHIAKFASFFFFFFSMKTMHAFMRNNNIVMHNSPGNKANCHGDMILSRRGLSLVAKIFVIIL